MQFPRESGILLHPTSLPGPHGIGDFGPAAFRFVEWLEAAGQRLWQVMPLGPTGTTADPADYDWIRNDPASIGDLRQTQCDLVKLDPESGISYCGIRKK